MFVLEQASTARGVWTGDFSDSDAVGSSVSSVPARTIRPPWPDELERLRHFLPEAFLLDENPQLFVGVAGAEERLVAVGALTRPAAWQSENFARLYLRTASEEGREAWLTALVRAVFAHAITLDLGGIRLGQTLKEDSLTARVLTSHGFRPEAVTEVYTAGAQGIWERLQRLHARMQAQGMVPAGARLSTLLPTLLKPVREFFSGLPGAGARSPLETTDYKLEQSLVLLLHGEVKGVFLCRRRGPELVVNLRMVAPELRGGSGWANLLLLHAAGAAAIRSGWTETSFEANPELHEDTRQLARNFGARLTGRRVLLSFDALAKIKHLLSAANLDPASISHHA